MTSKDPRQILLTLSPSLHAPPLKILSLRMWSHRSHPVVEMVYSEQRSRYRNQRVPAVYLGTSDRSSVADALPSHHVHVQGNTFFKYGAQLPISYYTPSRHIDMHVFFLIWASVTNLFLYPVTSHGSTRVSLSPNCKARMYYIWRPPGDPQHHTTA